MSILIDAFREAAKKTKDFSMTNEQQHSVAYPTGFLPIDFLNGYVLNINGRQYPQIGIMDGSINAVIARSGAGKSTICIQWAANIIRRFRTSSVFIDNTERGLPLSRAIQLSGFTEEEFNQRFILRDGGINTENVYQRVKMIRDIKVANASEYMYDTGIIDGLGKPIYKFEPTVYILDSLKSTMPAKLSEDEGTNMNGATTARINADIFNRLIPICGEANIIMLVINHITTGGVGSIMPQKASVAYLKQGESLPGGKDAGTYLNNNIFRLDEKTKLKSVDTFGIDGAVVNIDIIKSRSNKAGKGATLIFDQNNGYDPDLSLFMYLKDNAILEGSGAYLKLPGLETKFSQKAFKQKLYSDPEFYNTFINVCYSHLLKDLLDRESHKQHSFGYEQSPYEAIIAMINNRKDDNNE